MQLQHDYEKLRRILDSPSLTVEEKLTRVKKWLRGSEAELKRVSNEIKAAGWELSPRFRLIQALLSERPKQSSSLLSTLKSAVAQRWCET